MTGDAVRVHTGRMSEQAGDYGYDQAHDVDPSSVGAAPSPEEPVRVVTESSDDGQDYGYDLAHDVPR